MDTMLDPRPRLEANDLDREARADYLDWRRWRLVDNAMPYALQQRILHEPVTSWPLIVVRYRTEVRHDD